MKKNYFALFLLLFSTYYAIGQCTSSGFISASQAICIGADPAILTQTTAPTAAGGTLTHDWQSSTDGTTFTSLGVTTQDYDPLVLTQNTWYKRVDTFDGGANTCDTNTLLVGDTTNPTIACPGNQIGSVDASCNFSIPDYTGLATAAVQPISCLPLLMPA